jgi:predicted type IV restriction endonuclease
MDFNQAVENLVQRSKRANEQAKTEEATKTAVIFPFIQTLGFDIFSLDEVVPEFVADIGTKKGEKVDFVLKISGTIQMLIEAKPIGSSLGSAQHSQLHRYFGVTSARIAVLTNGREFQFYSDTEVANVMDRKPFFQFDLQNIKAKEIEELHKFHKDNFSVENILESASKQQVVRQAITYLKEQFASPSDEFVKLICKSFYEGIMTKPVIESLRPAVTGAFEEILKDAMSSRLGIAFPTAMKAPPVEVAAEEKPEEADLKIFTTEDELQGFMIVKAIAMQAIDISRITMRDSQSYCAIFADDNNRKPICRLYFNSKTNYQIGIFDDAKAEIRHKIGDLSDIYNHAEAIRLAAKVYAHD